MAVVRAHAPIQILWCGYEAFEQERYISVLASVYEPYTVGVWMRASTATRCPLALLTASLQQPIWRPPAAHPTIGDARPASEVVTRSPPTNEKETFTFGWLRLLGTVRAWCRSCAMKLLLVVALETINPLPAPGLAVRGALSSAAPASGKTRP